MTDDRFYRTTFLVNMADSSDEDAAAAVFVMLHTSRKRKKRKRGYEHITFENINY